MQPEMDATPIDPKVTSLTLHQFKTKPQAVQVKLNGKLTAEEIREMPKWSRKQNFQKVAGDAWGDTPNWAMDTLICHHIPQMCSCVGKNATFGGIVACLILVAYTGKSLHHMTKGNHNWAVPVGRYTDFHSKHGNTTAGLGVHGDCGSGPGVLTLVDKKKTSTRDAVTKTIDEAADVDSSAASRDQDLTSMVDKKDRAVRPDVTALLQR
jgi:hypothetical protein